MYCFRNFLFLFFVLVTVDSDCSLSKELQAEIASYADEVEAIINATTIKSFKDVTYNELAKFIDTFGNRRVGSQRLEDAIDYMLELSKNNSLENVHGEEVDVPNWIRGEESVILVTPNIKTIPVLGLIYSVSTPADGILADVLVVKNFDELSKKASLAKNKIVVFNQEWESYGVTNQYRGYGAREAARVGAVATLIRSVTPFSPANPHTGILAYDPNITAIPAACIAENDAKMLQRLQDRNESIQILLKLISYNGSYQKSQNAVAELVGKEDPEKVVIVSAHVDSVDVGEGAMDNAGGVFISWAAPVILKLLGLRPRRTVRAIYWTAEEAGGVGLAKYQAVHAEESDKFVFIMDTDVGTFTPLGIDYEAGETGGCILQEILKLLSPINATQANVVEMGLWPGFPMASLANSNPRYFWFHHSREDTMDIEDPEALNKCAAVWTAVAYVIADLSIDFPRN